MLTSDGQEILQPDERHIEVIHVERTTFTIKQQEVLYKHQGPLILKRSAALPVPVFTHLDNNFRPVPGAFASSLYLTTSI